MSVKSDGVTYGKGTRALHWSIALIILCLIASGYLADDLKGILTVIPTHKAVGILVLFLGLARLLWWLLDGPRPGDENMGPEKYLARLVKWALAAIGIAMPLSGWLMSSAADKPILFFGLFQVPPLLSPDKDIAHFFKECHETIGSVLVVLLILHVAGALRHHFLVKDNVLTRMLPCAARFTLGGDKQQA
ncbi:MAG TPA: cytochrome b [Candidatus Sulfotelmatobacter sp.]|nr:cytochrome b [Candidatus Sulfotelmatobacter sp.]